MGIEANSQNRWRTARERARLKARYEIHTRIESCVVAACPAVIDDSDKDDSTLHRLNTALRYLQAVIKNDLSAFSVAALARDGRFLNGPLPLVECRDSSHDFDLSRGVPKSGAASIEAAEFALCMLLSTACPWNEPDSTRESRLAPHLQQQPATLATSKFGREFVATRLVPYIEHLTARGQQLALIEYASVLGRHGIVALLLLGGVDPTLCANSACSHQGDSASRQVLALLHSLSCHSQAEHDASPTTIPLSLWSYIVRSVVEMRMNGVLDDITSRNTHSTVCCQLCHHHNPSSYPFLSFGPPCHHTFCEPCLWKHLVHHVPNCTRLTQNVVTCPKCHVDFEGFELCRETHSHISAVESSPLLKISHESKDAHQLSLQREQRRLDSLAKFMSLANTSDELKTMTRKQRQDCQENPPTHTFKRGRRKERDPIHSTWGDALRPIISGHLSKDVRSDRFFKAAVSSPQMVIAYLEEGIDVNMQNAYGQTPLYIACWKGLGVIVECLLEYGADASIPANGGSTCWSVAKELRRMDVLAILKTYDANSGNVLDCSITPSILHDHELESQPSPCVEDQPPQVTILIDPGMDHPGAGACIVDNALSEGHLQKLEVLWRKLPVASRGENDYFTTADNQANHTSNEKSQYRPTRSYYCDSEQAIQTILLKCIDTARNASITHLRKDEEGEHSRHPPKTSGIRSPPNSVFHHLRFLYYEQKGGLLPPHVDLCRVDDFSGCRSTHTFILYLTDCLQGGGTALLQHLNDPQVLAVAQPKRGRALIFPHLCPHCGLEVDSAPKVLLRGEVIM